MKIEGCDLHRRYQQVAMLDDETGELLERRLEHESGEAQVFYATLSGAVRVGDRSHGAHPLVRANAAGVGGWLNLKSDISLATKTGHSNLLQPLPKNRAIE